MVGMARRAVPARVVAGGTNIRATLPIEGVAPLHAARTSQRVVPTTLNRYIVHGLPSRGRSATGLEIEIRPTSLAALVLPRGLKGLLLSRADPVGGSDVVRTRTRRDHSATYADFKQGNQQ